MKKSVIIALVTLLSISVIACNNKKANTETTNAETTSEQLATNAPKDTATIASTPTNDAEGSPIHLTTEEFKLKVANYETTPNEWKYLGDKPCIIDFWATWCPPCKAIAPILEELAMEYKNDIYIYKVDVDEQKELAQVFGIQSIPTLLFVPINGQPKTEVGALTKDKFKENIDGFLLKK